ncbi:DODA-type extradiol aromatic ring-opening family dioxygenase [Halomonas huangheensis]|uniref:Extradiol ring-cleavage dioxygenase class III enzyme subunit B domain-containing protein n=1 Tax=Halomonas huangheensis TaxID=1178482 RepID=W1N9Y4_9GAMM|nr:class III extradiol ring-cleavage dioxygenase [Halomonas huangheensis]ALM53763.1 dioxygenase [Halomonas huangheensis]ERL52314.1 hypothetical protein BJB45_10125 [Halomonas huangheensis]
MSSILNATPEQALPTLFLPHGAGPCFYMDWQPADEWLAMAEWLRQLPAQLGVKPRALVVISAHWQAQRFAINVQPCPELYYDYYGFPEHTYQLQWPVPGDPQLARQVAQYLAAAGLESVEESSRGLDHGVFVPLKLAFPEAEIPVVQVSLKQGLAVEEHLALGRALAPLREQGVLIVASGMSYHNMARLMRGGTQVDPDSQAFDQWLGESIALPAQQRDARLVQWSQAPGARAAHPEEEHLLPLMVAAGAAGDDPGTRIFQDQVMGSVQSAFAFGI